MKKIAVRIGLIALSTAVVVTSGVALAQSPPRNQFGSGIQRLGGPVDEDSRTLCNQYRCGR